MEKFSKWRDASTGIQPFLPPKPDASDDAVKNTLIGLKYYVWGPVLAVVRLVLATVVSLWLLVFLALASIIPIPPARWFLRNYVSKMGCRVVLGLLGFWWIQTEKVSSKVGREATVESGAPGAGLKSGDVIVANWNSYVDIIYLGFRFAPTFTKIVKTGDSYQLVPLSIFAAVQTTFKAPTFTPTAGEKTYTMAELQRSVKASWGGPIVVLAEGTTTNNRTVLPFVPGLLTPSKEHQLQIVGFKYTFKDFAPSYTVGSPFGHLFGLVCQLVNTLEVKYINLGETKELQLKYASTPAVAAKNAEAETFETDVGTKLANLLRVRRVRLTAADKVAFLDFYQQRQQPHQKGGKKSD